MVSWLFVRVIESIELHYTDSVVTRRSNRGVLFRTTITMIGVDFISAVNFSQFESEYLSYSIRIAWSEIVDHWS